MPDRSSPLLIAPWLEIPSLRRWVEAHDAIAVLQKYNLTLSLLIQNFLDSLQAAPLPTVNIGYTVAINVFDLFSRDVSGHWKFDASRMDFFTDLFRKVDRPVIVNLRANHFVGEDPLVAELMSHESSYARLNDGTPVRDDYYSNPVFAPNFSLDETLPINRYRFGGFQRAISTLGEFDKRYPGIIHAVTLAGELHHFLPELANPQAAGKFDGARMTDYSPESIRDFIAWLQTRHTSIEAFNQAFGTTFRVWDEVEPPRWDLRNGRDEAAWNHMDSYADGKVPLFGWMTPPLNGSLAVYLDGNRVGIAEYGLNRLDVYDAVPWLADADVGFRFDLDYRQIPAGRHRIHVVFEKDNGRRYLVGERRLNIAGTEAGEPPVVPRELDRLPDCVDAKGDRFAWLDHPLHDLVLRFNPYANEWQEFRQHQIDALLAKFAGMAIQAGFPPEKLYSHQIMPQFEGSWNHVAFAVGETTSADHRFSPGINLYGGAAIYRGIAQSLNNGRYAVAELHPRMGKSTSRDVFLRTLQYHYDLGADFLCPYFMALREPRGQRTTADPDNLQDALLIHQLNIAVGSLYFYSALVNFLNRGR